MNYEDATIISTGRSMRRV